MWNLGDKIEDIRQKPENIRMRFVYIAVGVSMLFVMGIFLLNVKVNFSAINQKDTSSTDPFTILRGQVEDSIEKSDAPTLDDLRGTTNELNQQLQEAEDREAAGLNTEPVEKIENPSQIGPDDTQSQQNDEKATLFGGEEEDGDATEDETVTNENE